MLNVDYKIGSEVIAERIKPHLPKLVHHNQVGYVTGRQISNNIRAISNTMYLTKLKNIPDMIINIDFEKAFDSVNWEFLKLTN
jgi:ribosome biogenesis protein Tsr3